MGKREQWDTEAVASHLGVASASLRRMRLRKDFMPAPDGYVGRSPWWWSTTVVRWNKDRPRRGWQGSKAKKSKVSA